MSNRQVPFLPLSSFCDEKIFFFSFEKSFFLEVFVVIVSREMNQIFVFIRPLQFDLSPPGKVGNPIEDLYIQGLSNILVNEKNCWEIEREIFTRCLLQMRRGIGRLSFSAISTLHSLHPVCPLFLLFSPPLLLNSRKITLELRVDQIKSIKLDRNCNDVQILNNKIKLGFPIRKNPGNRRLSELLLP